MKLGGPLNPTDWLSGYLASKHVMRLSELENICLSCSLDFVQILCISAADVKLDRIGYNLDQIIEMVEATKLH